LLSLIAEATNRTPHSGCTATRPQNKALITILTRLEHWKEQGILSLDQHTLLAALSPEQRAMHPVKIAEFRADFDRTRHRASARSRVAPPRLTHLYGISSVS
jgi:hypothetical protein